MKKRFFALILTVIILITGCSNKSEWGVAPTEPHVPNVSIPRVRIGVPYIIGGKTYIPLEFAGEPLLREIKNDLPVITYYPVDYSRYDPEYINPIYLNQVFTAEIAFDEIPERVSYTLYDENFEEIYSADTFTPPEQVGDYILRIDAVDTAYLVRIVIGEPREECRYIDRYHGGGAGLMVYDFGTLLEIRSLLDTDDEAIEEYLSNICVGNNGERNWECPCFLQTRADIQNLFSWLRLDELRLPLSDSVPLREMLIRDSYEDIYIRYEIGAMLFNFYFSPGAYWNADEGAEGWHDNGIAEWLNERVITFNDVNVYAVDIDKNPDVSLFLSVNGRYMSCHVSIPCMNPETCERGEPIPSSSEHYCRGEQVDRQAAIDGLMQFEFKTLF